jgi:hypothetical protein
LSIITAIGKNYGEAEGLTTPLVVLRVTSLEEDQFRDMFESVLITRYEKCYHRNGLPTIIIIPIHKIRNHVWVAEDFPVIYNHKKEWKQDVQELIKPILSEDSRKNIRTRKISRLIEEDVLARDWAYALKPREEWGSDFWNPHEGDLVDFLEIPSPDIDDHNYLFC